MDIWGFHDTKKMLEHPFMNGHHLDRFSDYNYYDTPEGQNYFEKLWYCMKHSLKLGILFTGVDVLLMTNPRGYVPVMHRTLTVFLPFPLLGGFVLPTSIFVLTVLREKDDPLNYGLAGATVSLAAGYWFKNAFMGLGLLPWFFFFGCMFKYAKTEMKHDYWPDDTPYWYASKEYLPYYNAHKWDFSVYEQRPKGWVKAEDVAAAPK